MKLKHINLFYLLLSVLILSASSITHAHFDRATSISEYVITSTANATEVYVRLPLNRIFAADDLNSNTAKTFLINRSTTDQPPLYLSTEAIYKHRAMFTKILSRSLRWSINGRAVSSRVRAYRLQPVKPDLDLRTSAIGRQSLRIKRVTGDISLSTGVIDMLITIDATPADGLLGVRASTLQLLPENIVTQNRFTDERRNHVRRYGRNGNLQETMKLPYTQQQWVVEYIKQGTLHVLEGLDHVLLVIALAFSFTTLIQLFKNVSAFTLGHAATMAAAFLGYTPTNDWFVPLVEIAIAATIVFAVIASQRQQSKGLLLYICIGFLHGLGFSFVLSEILAHDTEDLALALAAFTIGIELGQILVIAAVLLIFATLKKIRNNMVKPLRYSIRYGLIAASGYLFFERVYLFAL